MTPGKSDPRITKIIAALAGIISASAFPRHGAAKALGSQEDENAIRGVVAAMTDGFNRHDATASSRMYSEDADFTNVAGTQVKGAAAIETLLADGFRSRLRTATQKTEALTIRFILPDVALVHVRNRISGFKAADETVAPPHVELSLRVFQKIRGAWVVVAFHNTSVAASYKPTDGETPK